MLSKRTQTPLQLSLCAPVALCVSATISRFSTVMGTKNVVPSSAGPRSKARLVTFYQTPCLLFCRSRRNLKLASSTSLQRREDQPFPMCAVERKGQTVLQHSSGCRRLKCHAVFWHSVFASIQMCVCMVQQFQWLHCRSQGGGTSLTATAVTAALKVLHRRAAARKQKQPWLGGSAGYPHTLQMSSNSVPIKRVLVLLEVSCSSFIGSLTAAQPVSLFL